ncbi:MAG: amino acid adenylation domain-containing protein, partial [Pseudolabrys sp.]
MEMAVSSTLSAGALAGYVADLMGVSPQEIQPNISLVEAGLDSISMMRIADYFRSCGYSIKFDELIADPTIDAWLRRAAQRNGKQPAVQSDVSSSGSAFELTPVQQAYWFGRQDDQPLGGVGCHLYLELDGKDVDSSQLELALAKLKARHPMLRARFLDDGLQRIEPDVRNIPATVHDLRKNAGDAIEYLEGLRNKLSHRRLDVADAELLDLQVSLLPGGRTRMHINVDLLVADVLSITIILRDLTMIYLEREAELPPLDLDFERYLMMIRSEREPQREAARHYWSERLSSLPGGPMLPLAIDPSEVTRPQFVRRQFHLDTADVERLHATARSQGLTLACVLATAFGEVLGRWSDEQRFLINVPLFDRQEIDPSVSHMVADFTSLVLLEMNLEAEMGFAERAKRVQVQLHRDIAHAAYSGVDVLRDLARSDQGTGRAAPVVFACNLGVPFVLPVVAMTFGRASWMISQTPQVWLDHQTYPTEDGLLLNWDAVDQLFPSGTLDTMFAAYEQLVRSLVNENWEQSARLPLPEAEAAVRESANATEAPLVKRQLHEAFFERVSKEPERIALIGQGSTLSYRELAGRALRVAGLLRKHGVGEGDVVGIALPKSAEQVIAVLGVVAAGATYLPISWDQPAARTKRICQRAVARVVLTRSERLIFDGWPEELKVVDLALAESVAPLSAPVRGSPNQSAYIIFTSGSTGEPKGVEVFHGAAWNTVACINEWFAVTEHDRVLALSALEFDLSVYDIFGLLSAGGAIVMIDDAHRRDPNAWLDLEQRYEITVWNSVPALLEMAAIAAEQDHPLKTLRLALISGDWIPLDLPARLRGVSHEAVRFVGLGGATEAAIWSNAIEVRAVPASWPSIPYGRPLRNQQFRVVDAQGRDCPNLVAGELWIGGEGLAHGYKGAPDLTAERFVFADGRRWYRTGDRGRYWDDGTLEFLGRIDQQVKIRGHRIELGEIEAALERYPGVVRVTAAVLGQSASRSIGAAVVLVAPCSETEILDFVREQLPDHMVPQRLAFMEALPLTQNGKVDRATVARVLELQTPARDIGAEEPKGPTECALAALWNETLGTSGAGRRHSFFQLGGNSLQAARLAAKIGRAFGVS